MVSLLAVTTAAQAQTVPGFSLDRFNPSDRGSDWFAGDSLDLRGNNRIAAGLVADYASNPLAVYTSGSSSTLKGAVVSSQFFLHLGASYNLFDWLRIGLNLPVLLTTGGTQESLSTSSGVQTYASPSGAGVGDVRLSVTVRLLGTYGDPFTLAVAGQVFFPSGSRSSYTSDGTVRFNPYLMGAGAIGPFVYSAQVGVGINPLSATYDNSSLGSSLLLSGTAGVRLLDNNLVIGPEVYGSTAFNSAFKLQSSPLEGILGAHYLINHMIRVGLGGGPGFTRGFGAPQYRLLGMVEYAPSPEVAPSDRDKDGIVDAQDACPDTPGVKSDDPKKNGCPPDRDGDGILDAQDACPDTPGVKSDDPKKNGCPEDKDRDKDGIPNDQDACPDEPGKPDPDPKKNGCPKAFVKNNQIVIVDQVRFKTDSAEIVKGKDSEDILNAVLEVLQKHPEIKHVRVEGHTDNKGSAAHNKTLSAKRAQSVVKWLVQHGVEKSRLSSQGFGSEHPIADNKTEDGRRQNRRVEFHIE